MNASLFKNGSKIKFKVFFNPQIYEPESININNKTVTIIEIIVEGII